MFRISKQCFDSLCNKIEASVSEDVKSEIYFQMVEAEGYSSELGRMFHLHKLYLGDFIRKEIKLVITLLRLLAGSSYLDLVAVYVCGSTYENIDFYKNLTDDDEMKKKL